jgi:hypothetical protein
VNTVEILPSTEILHPTYENVEANCPMCSHHNIFNRVSDLRNLDPICNATVVCQKSSCGSSFQIYGDHVNSGYESLLIEASHQLRSKKYMSAVILATTACEMFFYHFLIVELVLRPSGRDAVRRDELWIPDETVDELQLLNKTADSLQSRLKRHTFGPMCNVFLRIAIDNTRPATMNEAARDIAKISQSPKEVTRDELSAITDPKLRELLIDVHDLKIKINGLRNSIVHKTAYRPHEDEARKTVDRTRRAVFAVSRHFDIKDLNHHINFERFTNESLDEINKP